MHVVSILMMFSFIYLCLNKWLFFFSVHASMLTGIILLENLKWLLPTTFMIGAAPAYITIWAGWRAVSAILPRSIYVKGDDFLFSTYHRNLLFFFETLTGAEVSLKLPLLFVIGKNIRFALGCMKYY